MRRFWLKVALGFCFWGIISVTGVTRAETIQVFVSIAPQKFFVEKIGGELVNVSIMVRPGASPTTYEPKPDQMVALSKSSIYFAIGVPFEKAWLGKIVATNHKMMLVYTQEGIEKIPMESHRHEDERTKDKDDHQRSKDPHLWLSPPLVMLQARNILHSLLTIDPFHRYFYEKNYKKFIMEIVELDAEIREIFTGNKNETEFMVFHPAWGYFARDYGLKQIPVELEGKEPKPGELKHLIENAREKGIRAVFVQLHFSTKSAETVANAIGGEVVFVDPLSLDWANNLRKVAENFKVALK